MSSSAEEASRRRAGVLARHVLQSCLEVYLLSETSSGLDLSRKAFVRRVDKAIGSGSVLARAEAGTAAVSSP